MPSLFEPQTGIETLERIKKLQPNSQRQWGKMNVAQMMAHVRELLLIATGEKNVKPSLIGKIMAPFIKPIIMSNKPFRKNLPTGPDFVTGNVDKDFTIEKELLINTYTRLLQNGEQGVEGRVHPLFGKLSSYEWGFSQWKHLDHHLKQFSV